MEDLKISLFESEHKCDFPQFKTLTQVECESLVGRTIKKYNLENARLEKSIVSIQSFHNKAHGLKDFRLLNTMKDLGIKPLEKVFINWYRFDKIDLFATNDIDKYFDNIWFPGADDIDLFDNTLDWILSVRHDGAISFIKKA